MSILSNIKSFFTKGVEGSYRGPATGYSHWGNPFPVAFGDGFQAGLTLNSTAAQNVPIVYASVMATAKAVSTCYAQHMTVKDGKAVKSTTSPASRVLRKPNSYQTWPQFVLNSVAMMLFYGESFIMLARDERYAVSQMHLLPRGSCTPYVTADGEVFYAIGENPMNPQQMSMMAPSRDIIHLRQYCPRHPLIGESPLTAAALAVGINVALSGNQAAFFTNMNRPSGILSTDQILTRDQMQQLRQAFDEQAKGMNSGKIPVLSGGLKFAPMSISSQDAQVMDAQRMSIEDVARVFGVPLPIVGDLSKATMSNTEAMINFWLSTGLGSLLELLERSFDAGLGIAGEDYIELDTKALLRMAYKERIEGLTRGIQGGLITPNEAREYEGMPAVEDGDTILVQQQMVSLEYAVSQKVPEPAAPAAAPVAANEPPPEAEPEADKFDPVVARALILDMMQRKQA